MVLFMRNITLKLDEIIYVYRYEVILVDVKNFDIEQYVRSHILSSKNEEDLSQKEYDTYLGKKENMAKNVRNLLKYFSVNQREEGFSFNKDVLGYFPLEQFDSEDIAKFLDHIFSLKAIDNFTGNKVAYNLSKISVDNPDKIIKGKTRSFDFFYMHKPPKNVFEKKINHFKYKNRYTIRKQPQNVKSLIESCVFELEMLKEERVLSNLTYVVDYVADLLLQIFNYWVISFKDFSLDKRMKMVEHIESYLQSYKKSVIELNERKSIKVSLEDAVSIFISFLIRRNDYGEYMEILKVLEEEQSQEPEFFVTPQGPYKIEKGSIVSEDIEKDIITEGIYVDEYADKLKKTKEIITVFSQYGMRTADIDSVFDIKVYFREIYLSDSKYKRQAKTIVRKYLKKCQNKKDIGYSMEEIIKSFEKQSEYQFLREKINRGYFRETCDMRLYSEKNKLQKSLYEVLLDILLTYNYAVSIDLLEQLINHLIPICFKGIDDLLETICGHRIF